MLKPADMFDRDREWSQVADFIDEDRPGATLGVVSGRRRQGKSFLLEAACQQAGGFYYSAQEATEAESLSLIGAALTNYLNPVAPISPTDWQTVMDILLRLGRERGAPVDHPGCLRTTPRRTVGVPYPAAAVRVGFVVHGQAAVRQRPAARPRLA